MIDDSSDLLDDISQKHLKDIKLAIEYKYLVKHAPGGIFILPEVDNLRCLHGVIFVRRGLYRDGIFRFQMKLPNSYNDINEYPQITFTHPIYNPLIDPETGAFDLRAEPTLKEWTPQKHFCVTALIFLKRAFYTKSYEDYALPVANETARLAFESDKDLFLQKVQTTVQESQKRIYEEQSETCTLRFTRPIPAHDILKEKILYAAEAVETGAAQTETKAEMDCDDGSEGGPAAAFEKSITSSGNGALENRDSNVTKKLFDYSADDVTDESATIER